ncbi:MAG: glycosyltransferase family 39 protein [Mariniphaga sp.]|nr:glycosyltransferase family 39 protein [Mariniphaga sp.]
MGRKKITYWTAIKIVKFFIIFYALGITGNLIYKNTKHIPAEKFVMRSDSEGYYQYLPHFFIYDWDDMGKMHWAKDYKPGVKLNMYTCGIAIMQIPFFFIAHFSSIYFELEADGYTSVYFMWILLATIFYVGLGLLFLYKSLRRYFSKKISFWTTLLIFFATNLYYYSLISPGMSHAYSFSLISMFVYFVPRFYDKQCFKNILMVSIPLGLATLIRPTNILIVLYFFFYGITNINDFRNRLKLFFKNWYYILTMLIVGIVIFIPQMLYWHTITGKYIFYSYRDEGTFPFLWSPKILTVLFGARNGWYIYTPLMFLASCSLIYLVIKKKLNSLATLIIMIVIIYINSSWWRPTFSSATGYRALIGFYPFMVIPLAFLLNKIYTQKRIVKIAFTFLLVIFVVYNLLFNYQYNSDVWWNHEWTWSNFSRLITF